MIYFIGAGPGAVDLITVRGAEILRRSGMIIFAGSLVNPELVRKYARPNCEIYDSAFMTLDEIMKILINGHKRGLIVSRLHSGDPSLFGAINEQMNILRSKNINFEIIPGVSSLFAAAAALKTEYTIPEISQTLVISRKEGRTPVPDNKSLVFFLSAGMIESLCKDLISKGYEESTPAALVYKASWPEESIIIGNLANLPELVKITGLNKSALILVGDFLKDARTRSRLYDKNFSHGFRNNSGLH